MRRMVASGVSIAFLAAGLAGGADVAAPKPVEYPHVGVALALPEGFERRQPVDQTEVLRAIRIKSGKPASSLKLSAFVVDKQTTAKGFSAERISQLEAALAVRDLEVLKETAMPVAGVEGLAQRLRYTYRGENVEAAGVCFVRPPASKGHRLCYLLSVECATEHVDALLPVLGDVIKSIIFVAIRCPVDAPVGPLGPAIVNAEAGYAYRPPLRWYASWVGGALVTGQADYLRPELALDGLSLPQLRVVATAADPDTTSQASANQCRERIHQLAAEQGSQSAATLLSEGPAKLSGLDAHQFVILQTPKSPPATEPASTMPVATGPASTQPAQTRPALPAQAGEPLVIAQRTLCAQYRGKPTSYSLILVCPTDDGKVAEAMLDKLSEGFSLTEAPTGAATQPATSPSEEK